MRCFDPRDSFSHWLHKMKGQTIRTVCVLLALAVAVSIGVMGCSEDSSSILGPNSPSLDQGQNPGLTKGPVVASASGSAHMYISFTTGPSDHKADTYRVCTFNAREYSDGSYSGELSARDAPDQDFVLEGEVLQVQVHNNLAKLIFKITKAGGDWAGLEGFHCCYVVADNGEGTTSSSPDMNTIFWVFNPVVTWYFLDLTPEVFVELLEYAGYPGLVRINNGNIQVIGNSY